MINIKVLKMEDTKKVLKLEDVIDCVRNVYEAKASGNTEVFPLIFQDFIHEKAEMDIKSGWLKNNEIFGLKVVSWFEENPKAGLPELLGTILIFDANTGAPVGLVDGSYITGIRTGAAGALGAKALARPESENLLVVGTGNVAFFAVASMLKLFPDLKKIQVCNIQDNASAQRFAAEFPKRLEESFGMKGYPTEIIATDNLEKAVGESDIIFTVTPSREPLIKKEWLKEGTHLTCIGSDMEGKEEIDPAIFNQALVYVDDREQCINVGEIEIPIKQGYMNRDDIAGEIGEALLKQNGRENERQITVFDTTGVALLDLATGMLAIEEAEKQKLGQIVEI